MFFVMRCFSSFLSLHQTSIEGCKMGVLNVATRRKLLEKKEENEVGEGDVPRCLGGDEYWPKKDRR